MQGDKMFYKQDENRCAKIPDNNFKHQNKISKNFFTDSLECS
jgi:hypothetical protein